MLRSSSPRVPHLLNSLLHSPRVPRFLSSSSSPSPDPPIAASPPTQENVLYVLKRLTEKPDKALNFLNCLADKHAFKPSPTTHNLMLRILAPHKDRLKDFWLLLKSMDDNGHPIDDGTYLTLLSTFKKHKMKTEAAALAQFHTRSAQKLSHDSLVTSAARIVLESDDLGTQIAGLNLDLSETTVTNVLREVRKNPTKALSFFRWAGERPGYDHGSLAYNAMARVLGRDDSISDFWNLVGEMKELGHEMDIDTYMKLSRRFRKDKMMKDAVELYELMMDGPYKPDIQDCGILLRSIALSDAPSLELVYRVVGKYEASGFALSKVVYDGIHRSLTSIGRFEDADEITRKMKEEGHEPDNITYSQLVYGLCKAKRLDEACAILEDMEANECVPDIKTWTVLIQGHCSAGEVDKGLECMTKMIEKGHEADGDLVDIVVKGLCGERRAEGANSFFVEMIAKANVRPWQATYKYLIVELLKVGKLEEALKVLGLMKKQKYPPFADPFPSHISKQGTIEDAREFLKALTVKNYPSHTAYLNVFKAFFEEGRYTEAQDLLYKCPHHIRKHADICKLFGSVKDENSAII